MPDPLHTRASTRSRRIVHHLGRSPQVSEQSPGAVPSPPACRRVGGIRIHALDGGVVGLDGGAMFGVVPKPLWERKIPPDDRNRIPLALRCLLVEAPEGLVLVDTGVGGKEDAKFHDIYAIRNEGNPTRLEDSIRAAGFGPEEIDLVVLTHLHFDHAGGSTRIGAGGRVEPSFPNAEYVVQRGELDFSRLPNERIRASYFRRNVEAVTEAGLWRLAEGDEVATRGVRLLRTPGHTPYHQSVLIESGGETACFLADACPTRAHVPLPWIMGYDVEPLVSLETKRRLWRRAIDEEWLLVFEHDTEFVWGWLREDGRSVRPAEDEG